MMETIRTLTYDDKALGRMAIAFPPDQPFSEHLGELLGLMPTGEAKGNLLGIAVVENIFDRANHLGEYLATAAEPHEEILRIAALAASGEAAGIRLIHAALLTVPAAEHLVMELVEFKNVKRLMARIAAKEAAAEPLRESEDWFKKKAMLLSASHPLPGKANAPSGAPWLDWSDGVRRALADPDERWNEAIVESAKTELEALDLRIKMVLARINFNAKQRSTIYLITRGEETRWRIQSLEGARQRFGRAMIVIREKLGSRWGPMMESLGTTRLGGRIVDLFGAQAARVHPHPHIKTGASVIRSILMHPLLVRTQRKPDYLSCVAIYVESAGRGVLEVHFRKLVAENLLKSLLDLPGFALGDRILTIDLKLVPPAPFVDLDDLPRDVDWTSVAKEAVLSWRSLVITYMDNDNFIVELLGNPRVVGQPGIIPLMALKSRSARVLSIIANTRSLYSGFSNKEVPINLLTNPAKVPLTALRKFVHVRFLDKASLARLAVKGSQIREEVRREIQRYLSSLK